MKQIQNILIADDDQEDIELLLNVLQKISPSSIEAITVTNGEECLRLLNDGTRPDVIIMDLNMPYKNGIECLRDIKSNPSFDELPIIIHSTSHNYKDIDTCYKLGASFYVVKPIHTFSMMSFFTKVLDALGMHPDYKIPVTKFVLREK